MNSLGEMYSYGLGVDISYEEAAYYFRRAADQGIVYSQFYLGYLYENGLGVNKSIKKAMQYYKMAAEQGDDEAQERLDMLSTAGND